MIRFFGETACMSSLVVMTGFTMNLIPSRNVMNTEKPPMVADGIRLETQLPTTVNARTLTIMTSPFLISRFLFRPYVNADTALARTSEASAIPTAM